MTTDTSVKTFKRNKLSSAVKLSLSLLAIGTIAHGPTAFAQESEDAANSDDNIEEVIVSGQRRSLKSSQDIKELSEVVVDSITADDIGALPDRSVTESLQRVPGVAINRFSSGNDPDHFSVEGSGVVVRGLTYVRSELNGRDSFTANNGRGLSFADVPPELLGGVDVFKSPTADRIEGGIAGTVNLRTRLPFDSEAGALAFSLENNYGSFIEENTPTGSVLGSYRWDTSAGEFGLLGSAVYSQLKSRADKLQVSNFANRTLYSDGDVVQRFDNSDPPVPLTTPVSDVIFPRGAVGGSQVFDRERVGLSAAAQWRSADESMEATFQFLRSDSREAWTEHTTEIATDVVSEDDRDSERLAGTELEFTSDGVFDNGIITGPVGWRADQGSAWTGVPARVPVRALQSNNIRRDVDQQFVTEDISAKFEWNVNDELTLSVDLQHVDSTVDNIDVSSFISTYQNARIDLNGQGIPDVEFLPVVPEPACPTPADGSQFCPIYLGPGQESYLDPANSFYRATMDHIEESEGTSDSFRLDADWDVSSASDWFTNVRIGFRHADRDQTARFSRYNWNVLSEQWGGGGSGGPVWLNDGIDDVVGGNDGDPLTDFEVFSFDNFLSGNANNPFRSTNGGRLYNSLNGAQNYRQLAENSLRINSEWRALGAGDWVPLAARQAVDDNNAAIQAALDAGETPPPRLTVAEILAFVDNGATPFKNNEINPVEELNDAVYITARFANELDNGWDLSGNVGVRYARTRRAASGFQSFLKNSLDSDADCADAAAMGQTATAFCALDPSIRAEARAFANGAETPFNTKLEYSHSLPSINLKLGVAEGVQFRAAYFKGISAPDFGLTRAFYDVDLKTEQVDIDAGNGRPIARFSAGNSFLEPVESDNYDLTAEWYFSDVGQLTGALFYKELTNIQTSQVIRETLTNNGVSFDAIITTPINSDSTGRIKGFELAYQQTYDNLPGWMSGLGLQANYTNISSSGVPQSTLSNSDPDVSAGNQSTVPLDRLPLENLSKHTVNIAPFYDYGPWSLRLAYSWRDDFLLTTRDVIVPFQPVINRATGQLDASAFYSINDNWKIGIQGVNLTEEIIETAVVIDENGRTLPRSWFVSDARYVLSLRGKLW